MTKYAWEQYPNPDCNGLHLTRKLPSLHGCFDDERDIPDDMPQKYREFFAKLYAIRGLLSANSSPYHLQFMKARLFDWSEIRPRVIEILRELLGEIEEGTLPDRWARTSGGEEPVSESAAW
jgi:hypothetical protein